MTGYRVEVTCPACGSEMIPGESEVLGVDHSQATARCESCLDLYRLDLVATVCEPWPRDRSPEARERRARDEAAYHSGVTLEAMNQ